jgi:hypothetical protein
VFVYKSVDWWRTVHPQTSVVPSLMAPGSRMGPLAQLAFSLAGFGFFFLFLLFLLLRVRLADEEATLNDLYLAEED